MVNLVGSLLLPTHAAESRTLYMVSTTTVGCEEMSVFSVRD